MGFGSGPFGHGPFGHAYPSVGAASSLDQLLAALGIDQAQGIAVSGRLALIFRDPQPDETGIAIDSLVSLRIVDLDGDPSSPLPMDITVEIDLGKGLGFQVAYDGSSFQAPWNGPGSAVTSSGGSSPYVFQEIDCDQSPEVFSSEQVVAVRVQVAFAGSPPPSSDTLAETYQFTAQDLTAPRLVSAEPIDQATLRIRFNEAMEEDPAGENATVISANSEAYVFSGGETLDVRIDGASAQVVTFLATNFLDLANVSAEEVASAINAGLIGAQAAVYDDGGSQYVAIASLTEGDASSIQVTGGTANVILGFPTTVEIGESKSVLAPENFTVERQNIAPDVAVNLAVESVAAFGTDGDTFDLTFNWEMTPNAPYLLTVDGDVEDVSGNAIDPAWSSVSFVGFQPPVPANRRFDLWRFIPLINREQDNAGTGDLRKFINMLQEVLNLLLYDLDTFADQYDPDRASDSLIPLILYDQGNPFATWDDLDLTALQRRKLSRILVAIYKLKGTAVGIESVVRFLLGKEVEVVDYISDGWILGEDELGEGSQAEVISGEAETYDFSGVDRDLWVAIDGAKLISDVDTGDDEFEIYGELASRFVAGYVFQVVGSTGNDGTYTVAAPGAIEGGGLTRIPVTTAIPDATVDGRIVQRVLFSSTAGVDFSDPANATAEEVADAIEAQLIDGGAYHPSIGTRATVLGTIPQPFVINPGDQLFVEVNTALHTVTFDGTETSSADVAAEISDQLLSHGAEGFVGPGNEVGIRTLVYGSTQSVKVNAGGIEATFGLSTTIQWGTDAARVAITSDTVGIGSEIEILGGTANNVLDYSQDSTGGAGGAILGPSDSYTLYSFDVVSEDPLSSTEEEIIRRIANYMRCSHEHLRSVRGPTQPTPIEGWQLGISELGIDSELME